MSVTRLATRSDIPKLAELLGELFSQEREFAPDRTAQMRGLALLFDREDSVRGNGTGKRLMAAIIAQARSDGAQRLTLLADNDNLPARRFYENFGFTRSTMLPYRLMLPSTLTI